MKIDKIKAYPVRIPFSTSIDHNLKQRSYSESIVISIQNTNGMIGYGEGAPRTYVTNESLAETLSVFKSHIIPSHYPVINTLNDIKAWCDQLLKAYNMPSLVSALEIALLDLWGQSQQCSIASLLNAQQTNPICYSGVLPYLPLSKLEQWLALISSLKLQHLKVKVGHAKDLACLAKVRQNLGDEIDIRVDANRSWTFEEAVQNINQLRQFNISCVEEPLIPSQISMLSKLSQQIETPLLLDESVYTLDHAAHYIKCIEPEKLLFNLKISKSGGLLKTSELYHFAKENGIGCQLGCNVGETAILSAAGRIFAQTHHLKYLEGSFAPFFMEDDISKTPISFSKGGKAKRIEGYGLGISIDPLKLQKYSQASAIANA